MHQPQPSAANHSHNPFVGSLPQTGSLLTRKRVSLILTGAFLIAAAGYVVRSTQNNNTTKPQVLKVQKASATTEPTKSLNTNVSANGTDPPPTQSSQNQTNVSVNGQNIPVPTNGSTSQTVNSKNGQTTVNVSNSSTSSQSSSGASSSNSLNLNVSSSSDSSSSSSN